MKEYGRILNELDRIVDDEAEASAELAAKSAEKEESGVGSILKHIENVEAAADFIDKMTPGEKGDIAFDAEVALRKALPKMRELSDDVYKDEQEDGETAEEEMPTELPTEEV